MSLRQFFVATYLFVVAILGTACITSHQEDGGESFRFAIPDGAARVVVLGTAAPESKGPVADPIGRPRHPGALALWVQDPDRLLLIDTPPGIGERLAALRLPEGFGEGSVEAFDTFLWTAATPENAAGLGDLVARLHPELRITLIGPPGTAEVIAGVADLPMDRVDVRIADARQRHQLAPQLRVTSLHVPLEDGAIALGFGVQGAERRLLYLPRLGRLDLLTPDLIDLARPAAICLLDGRRWRSAPAGPSILEILAALAGLPAEDRILRFTHVAPENSAARPESRAARQLDASGAALAMDRQEWWL